MDPSHVKKYTDAQIENLALKHLGEVYPDGFEPPVDIELVVESHEKIGDIIPMPLIEDKFRVAACLAYRAQDQVFDIIVDEDTYLRQKYRANFSIAHEFGHIVLHSGLCEECHGIDDTIKLNERIKGIYRHIEDDANRFAGAILIPFTKIKIDTNEVYGYLVRKYGFDIQLIPEKIKLILAKRYDVSFMAMKIRLKELDLHNKISTAINRAYYFLDDL
jgi:Zn-dependent peptidase ImmA (M78 family)